MCIACTVILYRKSSLTTNFTRNCADSKISICLSHQFCGYLALQTAQKYAKSPFMNLIFKNCLTYSTNLFSCCFSWIFWNNTCSSEIFDPKFELVAMKNDFCCCFWKYNGKFIEKKHTQNEIHGLSAGIMFMHWKLTNKQWSLPFIVVFQS